MVLKTFLKKVIWLSVFLTVITMMNYFFYFFFYETV